MQSAQTAGATGHDDCLGTRFRSADLNDAEGHRHNAVLRMRVWGGRRLFGGDPDVPRPWARIGTPGTPMQKRLEGRETKRAEEA